MSPRILLLNGVGSAGKSTIARELQQIARDPFLHVAMDGFLEMLPAAYFDRPEGFLFETKLQDGKPAVEIHTGPVGQRLMSGFRASVAALAQAGNEIILDEVLIDAAEKADYRRLLAPFRLIQVGVMASLEILEAREQARGDRMIGLARWQFDRVHRDMDYDLVLDSGRLSAKDCATEIARQFDL